MYDIATGTRRLLAYYKEIHFMLTYLLKENIEKMLDRGDKLRELQERSGTLQMYLTIT